MNVENFKIIGTTKVLEEVSKEDILDYTEVRGTIKLTKEGKNMLENLKNSIVCPKCKLPVDYYQEVYGIEIYGCENCVKMDEISLRQEKHELLERLQHKDENMLNANERVMLRILKEDLK